LATGLSVGVWSCCLGQSAALYHQQADEALQNARGWTNGYYDDECWMATALTRAYDLTRNIKYLNQATALYADIMTGWDATCCGSNPGGLWWDKAHTQKSTSANAGAALLGARLYQRTGDPAYLSFAQQVYAYWYTNMVNPSTFQVCDHLNPDGSKTWWRYTYNEGLMIGAGVELNEATGNAGYAPEVIQITGISRPSPGSIHLTWSTVNGRSYQVQFRNAGGSGAWSDLGAPILASGPTASADDTLSTSSQRYYRIVEP
jgi:hypothetical protein